MTDDLVSAIFTIDVGDTPTVTFEVQNLREARELCRELWLKEDLAEARSGGVPLWNGKAKLRARPARPDEAVRFAEAQSSSSQSSNDDDVELVFLVELDDDTTV